jgi:hypothetical protein
LCYFSYENIVVMGGICLMIDGARAATPASFSYQSTPKRGWLACQSTLAA